MYLGTLGRMKLELQLNKGCWNLGKIPEVEVVLLGWGGFPDVKESQCVCVGGVEVLRCRLEDKECLVSGGTSGTARSSHPSQDLILHLHGHEQDVSVARG